MGVTVLLTYSQRPNIRIYYTSYIQYVRISVLCTFGWLKRSQICIPGPSIHNGCPGWTTLHHSGISIGHPLDGTGIHAIQHVVALVQQVPPTFHQNPFPLWAVTVANKRPLPAWRHTRPGPHNSHTTWPTSRAWSPDSDILSGLSQLACPGDGHFWVPRIASPSVDRLGAELERSIALQNPPVSRSMKLKL